MKNKLKDWFQARKERKDKALREAEERRNSASKEKERAILARNPLSQAQPVDEKPQKLTPEQSESLGLSLLKAVENKEGVDRISRLIKAGADLEARDHYKSTPLILASERGQEEIVKLLIEGGADLNARCQYGQTPLGEASYRGNIEIAGLLIKHGADPNICNNERRSALHRAACEGHAEICRMLIDAGADVNAKDGYGETALLRAVGSYHTKTAKLLIDAGADINVRNRDGRTALEQALISRKADVIELFLSTEKEVDFSSSLPYAIHIKAPIDLINSLIEKGADINYRNEDGETPLIAAIEISNKPVFELLISKGADINAECKNGVDLLLLAAEQDNPEFFDILSEKGAKKTGERYIVGALVYAIEKGDRAKARRLLAVGASADSYTGGYTVRGGFAPTTHYSKKSALMAAAINGDIETAELLIKEGANVNAKNEYNLTALSYSLKEGNEKMIELLIDAGADVRAETGSKENALMWAVNRGHKELAEKILRALLSDNVIPEVGEG